MTCHNLLPGDVIIFHGIVGGERRLCLVINMRNFSEDVGDDGWYTIGTIVNQTYKTLAVNLKQEDVIWSRINERSHGKFDD